MKRVVGMGLCSMLLFLALAAGSGPAVQAFGPRAQVSAGTSTNWSGYVVETNFTTPESGSVTDVRGDWMVPSVSSTSGNTYSAVWVGIDGHDPFPGTVEQIGTEQDFYKGQAKYYAWYELYPAAMHMIPDAVFAGDKISAEVKYVNGSFVLTLTDATQHWTFSASHQLNKALRNSAEWIVEAPGNIILPLAHFGSVEFSNASAIIDGHTGTISDSNWQAETITMVDFNGLVEATPSSLTKGGASFIVTQSP